MPLTDWVLIVKKDRPEWQKGRYNLPGGKIEEGEFPEEAAIRELEEEAGLKPIMAPVLMGEITGSWAQFIVSRFWLEVKIFNQENLMFVIF